MTHGQTDRRHEKDLASNHSNRGMAHVLLVMPAPHLYGLRLEMLLTCSKLVVDAGHRLSLLLGASIGLLDNVKKWSVDTFE